ncbi:hypothetical protein [Polaromonas sp.]|uniref:hypothetical protein n=1 Tax=Polaromonas sp. TaxID=1869339 RepID=UPI0017E5C9EF|nr:hypothetical protein [Polaromonas sp.]NML84290.1 hypothetical protein [Polaromonas sp.]
MLNPENPFATCAPFSLAAYTEAHHPDIRDLAEIIGLATCSSGAHSTLMDPEGSRAVTFMKCVRLYAANHGITERELSNDLTDWERVDEAEVLAGATV